MPLMLVNHAILAIAWRRLWNLSLSQDFNVGTEVRTEHAKSTDMTTEQRPVRPPLTFMHPWTHRSSAHCVQHT
eukprot:613229-Amphidinium_carterae.2